LPFWDISVLLKFEKKMFLLISQVPSTSPLLNYSLKIFKTLSVDLDLSLRRTT
jgi:hypothetical protein